MDRFRKKLLRTIDLCEDELLKRREGVVGESTEEQLEKIIIPELKKVLELVDRNLLPPKEQRYFTSFAHAFTVWGWNMQIPTPLFVLITELNNEYKKL